MNTRTSIACVIRVNDMCVILRVLSTLISGFSLLVHKVTSFHSILFTCIFEVYGILVHLHSVAL